MKPPKSYLNLRVTLSGRERVEVKPVLEVQASSESGTDHYAVLTPDPGAAGRLQIGTRGRLTFEGRRHLDGEIRPWFTIDDGRTFKVVSNLYLGGDKRFGDFLITFASQPDT